MPGMLGLMHGGLLDPRHWTVTEFPLEEVDNAVTHAAAEAGPFKPTVLKPWPLT